MYWTEHGYEKSEIVSGGMDGTGLVPIVMQKDLQHPTSIAINVKSLLWVDPVRQVIQYCRHPVPEKSQVHWAYPYDSSYYEHFPPQHVAIHEGKLYWAGGSGESGAVFKVSVDSFSKTDSPDFFKDGENYRGNINGMCVYHIKREVNQATTQFPDISNHSCTGISLLSSQGCFRCVCSFGLEPSESTCIGLFHISYHY